MPRNTTVSAIAYDWTELTSGNASKFSCQVITVGEVFITATETATKPTTHNGAIKLLGGQSVSDVLADLWPGIVGVRLWAWSDTPARVMISHD